MNIALHFVPGLMLGIASIPHCALMCGPLGAASCRSSSLRTDSGAFIAMRTLGYGVMGALAASISAAFLDEKSFRVLNGVAAALLVAYLLLSAWRLMKQANRLSPLVSIRRREVASPTRPRWWLGSAMSLIPCGALFGAYLIAAVSGTAIGGAASMVGFSLGSAPGLLIAIVGSKWLVPNGSAPRLRIWAGALLCAAGVMAWRGVQTFSAAEASCCAG